MDSIPPLENQTNNQNSQQKKPNTSILGVLGILVLVVVAVLISRSGIFKKAPTPIANPNPQPQPATSITVNSTKTTISQHKQLIFPDITESVEIKSSEVPLELNSILPAGAENLVIKKITFSDQKTGYTWEGQYKDSLKNISFNKIKMPAGFTGLTGRIAGLASFFEWSNNNFSVRIELEFVSDLETKLYAIAILK